MKKGFEKNFWVAILMTFLESGAYYGVLSILSVYLVLEDNEGGLGYTKTQAGIIMGTIQPLLYFLPIIAGGMADRYGYQKILFFAFACITTGYLFTAVFSTYILVFASLLIMAIGVGFFNPVISGTIAKSTTSENSALGFGIFYWAINLGAFLVPLILIPLLKSMGYYTIFYMAAGVGVLLFLINISVYKEPRLNVTQTKSISKVLVGVVEVLKDTKFIMLIIIYSGFWILYFQMFGSVLWYLKNHIDMTPFDHAINSFLSFFISNPNWKFDVEHVTVISAGAIVLFQFIISQLVKSAPALPTMIFGISCGTLSMFILSLSDSSWIFVAGIIVFTFGEMITHPKFISYISIIAPPDKIALYMGYSFLYGVIGSSLGSLLGANLYVRIVENMNRPSLLWLIFSCIGLCCIIGLLTFHRIVNKKNINSNK